MIDAHCHLHRGEYDSDRSDVIARAALAGVSHILTIGCDARESRAAVDLAASYSGVFASVGVHPHEAKSMEPNDLVALEALARHPRVIAYGEIGLDYAYDLSPRDIQRRVFAQQMELAAALDLPVIIHSREAQEDTLKTLRAFPLPRSGHAHCFTGTQDMADALLELGYFLGFTGIVTFKNAADLREVVRNTPLTRLLIETDSPYLAPVPFRGRRNEPAHVVEVCRAVAEIKGIDMDEVRRQTTENFRALFGSRGHDLEELPS